MTQLVKAGTASYREYYVRILDASTGAPYTSATSATAGASFGYQRPGGTRQSISLSDLSTIDAAYSSGGMKHVGSGWYRLDLPDAALASGVNSVTVDGAFTSYVVVNPKIQLVAVDLADAVRFGLTALPNAAAEASGGLYTRGTGAGQINQDANGRVDVNAKALIGTALTETSGGYLAAGLKKLLDVAAPVFTVASVNQTGDAFTRLGAPVGASHAADVANVAADLTTLLGRLTALRAGYLDNLSAGAVATASALATVAANVGLTATAAKLLKYVQLLARKDAAIATDNATELAAINANGGSGAGSFDNTTDSEQALRDRGDAAWTTGSSVLGSGSESVRIRCLNGAAPVDGAAVWITTDSAGTNVVAGTVYTSGTGYTSTIMLDPGTYYVWRQANGVNFTNPEAITVSDL